MRRGPPAADPRRQRRNDLRSHVPIAVRDSGRCQVLIHRMSPGMKRRLARTAARMRDYTDPIPPLLEADPTTGAESETPTHAEPDEVPDGYVRMVHYLTGQRRIVTERAYRAIHQYRGYVLADD